MSGRQRLHVYRCPKCQTTIGVRHSEHPASPIVVTCQASTYCASRGVEMALQDDGYVDGGTLAFGVLLIALWLIGMALVGDRPIPARYEPTLPQYYIHPAQELP